MRLWLTAVARVRSRPRSLRCRLGQWMGNAVLIAGKHLAAAPALAPPALARFRHAWLAARAGRHVAGTRCRRVRGSIARRPAGLRTAELGVFHLFSFSAARTRKGRSTRSSWLR